MAAASAADKGSLSVPEAPTAAATDDLRGGTRDWQRPGRDRRERVDAGPRSARLAVGSVGREDVEEDEGVSHHGSARKRLADEGGRSKGDRRPQREGRVGGVIGTEPFHWDYDHVIRSCYTQSHRAYWRVEERGGEGRGRHGPRETDDHTGGTRRTMRMGPQPFHGSILMKQQRASGDAPPPPRIRSGGARETRTSATETFGPPEGSWLPPPRSEPRQARAPGDEETDSGGG